MFLLFASDDQAQKLYIGVLCGDTAVVLHDWLTRDTSIPDSITFTNIPTVRFSAANQDNHQHAEWIKANVFMDRVVVPTWTWPNTRTRMPPTPPHTVRYFQIAVGNTPQTYTCSGFTVSTGPILSSANATVPPDNQISLLEAHLLQLTNPAPIPDINIAPSVSNKRRRTNGGN